MKWRRADGAVQMVATTNDGGRTYQVGTGNQYLINNTYYGGSNKPADLPDLRMWLARLATDYKSLIGKFEHNRREVRRQEKSIADLQTALNASGSDKMRTDKNLFYQLIAAGAIQYLNKARDLPPSPIPESVALDLVVFMLWPLVQVPCLPSACEDLLVERTSPRITAVVDATRRAIAQGQSVDVGRFAHILAQRSCSEGVLRLLEDLADPRGAGAFLTTLAIGSAVKPPPEKSSTTALMGWLMAGSGAGAVVEAVHLADEVVAWLLRDATAAEATGGSSSGDVTIDGIDHDHHVSGKSSHHSGHNPSLLDEVFDHLFGH